MPTKTPWPDPFSGFTEGFTGGMKMGLLRRQQNLAEQESLAKAAAEKEKKNFEQGTKYLELAVEYNKTGNPVYRKKALEFTSEGLKLLGKDPLPDGMEWIDGFDPVAKDVETAIKGFRKFGDRAVFGDALNAAYMKAGQALEDNQLKDFKAETEKRKEVEIGQQQADYLSQASQIPYLEQAGVLSPEESREGRYAALSGAGTKGVELLAKGLEGEKDQFYSMPTEEISQRLFNTPYAKLTPDQQGVVFKEEERIKKETEQRTKTGGKGKDELDVRKGIETILGKEMTSKFGGVKYDMINEQFVFPEKGIDQTAFWTEYTRRKRAYLKKYGLEEVLPEVSNESKEWKKYLPQGQ